MTFGTLVRHLRALAGLTQEGLASKAALPVRTISDVERGISGKPRSHTVESLAHGLGLSGQTRRLFAAAARGTATADSVLAACTGWAGPPHPAATPVPASPGRHPPGPAAFPGRAAELGRLTRHIAEVAAGIGGAVLIEGEPGIGKSALVRTALAAAGAARFQVFWGAGDELGQALPLLPLIEALRVREPSASHRRAAIARLLRGEVAAHHGLDLSATLAEQLLALVAEQCTLRPTILVVDDLQWADHASIVVCRRLARSVRQLPLLFIGMMRPVPRRDEILSLRRSAGDGARLRLGGLAEPAVAELLAALAGGRPGANLLQLAAGAAGNPLYLTEFVAALDRGASLTRTGSGTAELLPGVSAPRSLAAAIDDRLGFVSRPVREVLRAAALLGVDFMVPDLATVLGRGVADLMPALDEALAAGVLAESGAGLGFRHPLIRAALYTQMPAPVRAAWHREAGQALAGAAAPADRVARQLLWAVTGPGVAPGPVDEWMLSWLAGAAELLAGQAPQVAVELLRRAVASPRAGQAQRAFLAARLAEALYRIGDTAGAERVATQALAGPAEPDRLVDLHWTLAQCRMRAGEFAESLAALDRALATPGISARHRARLLVLVARTHSRRGEVERAGQVAATALDVAVEAGDNWSMGWALHVLTLVTAVQGQMADALPLFDRALAVTEADPALTDLGLLLQINKAVTLGNLDRHEEALSAARHALAAADQAGMVIRLVQAHSALGQLLFETGRWAEAMAEVLALHADLELKEPIAVCCDLGIAALICLHRGETGVARRHLAATVPYAERVGNRVIGPLALARSLERELAGALPEALAALTGGPAGSTEELGETGDLLADAVRIATAAGDPPTARALTAEAAALAASSPVPHRQAAALMCRGLLEDNPAPLLSAAAGYHGAGRPLYTAMALEAAAAALLRAGDHGEARAAATRALAIYTSLGASTDAGRLLASLGGLGLG